MNRSRFVLGWHLSTRETVRKRRRLMLNRTIALASMASAACVLTIASSAIAAPPSVVVPSTSASSAIAAPFGGLVPSTLWDYYNTAKIPAGHSQSATASCPAGTSAVSVGGGQNALGGLAVGADGASAVASSSAPFNDPNRFVQSVVTCAPSTQLAGTTTVARQSYAGNRGLQGVSWGLAANCPAGMRAFGGGGYFKDKFGAVSESGYAMSINGPSRTGRSWVVRAKNSTSTDTLVVTTRCAIQSASTRLVEEVFPMIPGPGQVGSERYGYAHCPAGYLPISGGAAITSDTNPENTYTTLNWSVPVRSGQIGWFAQGYSTGPNAKLYVYALCGS